MPLLKDRAASVTLFVSIRRIRQHTSAYGSVRQHARVVAPVPLLKGRAASLTLLPGGAHMSTCKSKPLLLKISRFSSTTISSGACISASKASTQAFSKALSKALTLLKISRFASTATLSGVCVYACVLFC